MKELGVEEQGEDSLREYLQKERNRDRATITTRSYKEKKRMTGMQAKERDAAPLLCIAERNDGENDPHAAVH